jgi:hypothetical protein
LSNSKCSGENTAKDSKTLLVKCEKFLSFFEKIYEDYDGRTDKDDSSYLDMGGKGKTVNDDGK